MIFWLALQLALNLLVALVFGREAIRVMPRRLGRGIAFSVMALAAAVLGGLLSVAILAALPWELGI